MRFRHCLGLTLIFLSLFIVSCGKKGPPKLLEPQLIPPPTALSAIVRSDEVVLTWGHENAGVREFTVMRKDSGDFTEVATVGDLFFRDRALKPGLRYVYAIKAGHAGGEQSATLEVALCNAPSRPQSPAISIMNSSVMLSWKSGDVSAGYNVYRSERSGQYGIRPISPAPILGRFSFEDEPYTKGSRFYVVRAVRADGMVVCESAPSEEAVLSPEAFVPRAPKGFRGAVGDGVAVLYWDESPEQWIAGYEVFRSDYGREFMAIGRSGVNAYTDRDVSGTGTLSYKVRAIGPILPGEFSQPLVVR